MGNSIELSKKVRLSCLDMVSRTNASHIGSALSIVDIVSVLYSDILNYNPKKPFDSNRDFFILSKGHACVAVYSVLAHVGFFDIKYLLNYGLNDSNLIYNILFSSYPIDNCNYC